MSITIGNHRFDEAEIDFTPKVGHPEKIGEEQYFLRTSEDGVEVMIVMTPVISLRAFTDTGLDEAIVKDDENTAAIAADKAKKQAKKIKFAELKG